MSQTRKQEAQAEIEKAHGKILFFLACIFGMVGLHSAAYVCQNQEIIIFHSNPLRK